jgi:O-antigen/teichoic acid export membrane protein
MTSDPEKHFESQIKRLASNGVALAAGGIVAQLAFTLLEILVARKLGAEAYGTFVTAYAWTVLAAFLMEIGTPLWTIQEGSRHHDRIPALLGSGLTVNLVMFAIWYGLLAAAIHVLSPNPVLSFLLVLLPYGLILAVQNGLASVYSSYQTMQVTAFFQGVAPVVILLVYFMYSVNDLALTDVGYSYVIGSGVVTGIWFVLTVRKVRPQVSIQNISSTLRSSYQYGLTGILGQVYYKADVVLISALAGVREAGIYAAAFKLVELVQKVATLSGRVFAPAIFKSSHESEKAFQMFASLMTRILAVSGLTAGVVTFVLADELIAFMFGDTYAASVPVLRILGGVMATMGMMVPLQLLLSSIDMHGRRVVCLGIALAVHIVANIVLIPKFGAVGAASATLFSGVFLILLYTWSAARRGNFRFLRWLLLPSCIAVAVATAAFLSGMDAYIGAVIAAAAFAIGLVVSGFVQAHEIRFVLRSMVSPTGRSEK